jgi:protein-L-isoaspartate O-methyltransferase
MSQEWQSYDTSAETHDRLFAPSFFAPPAEDLVASIGIPPGGTILDIGTGTGTVALVAKRFKQALSAEFYRKFRDPIEHTRDVYFAIGIKPEHYRAG